MNYPIYVLILSKIIKIIYTANFSIYSGLRTYLNQNLDIHTHSGARSNSPYSPNNPFCAATATAAARESTPNF